MIVDGRTVPDGERIDVDVCIVGAGPAGLTVAGELAGTDLRVCVLESGGVVPEPETAELAAGTTAGDPYFSLQEARARAIGGSSHRWDTHLRLRPLDAVDFERRPGHPWSGWPLGAEALRPYYHRAHAVLGVDRPEYDPAAWDPRGTRRLPANDDVATTLFHYTDRFDFTAAGRGVEHVANVLLLHHATAVHLEQDGGRIASLGVGCLDGTRFTVHATAYVLAAGGIENARLLLAGSGGTSRGIGNGSDLVGRFFMEHLHVRSGVLVPAAALDLGFYDQHVEDGATIRGAVGPTAAALRREDLLNTTFLLVRSDRLRSSDTFRSLAVVRARSRAEEAEPWGPHLRALLAHPLRAASTLGRLAAHRPGPTVYQLAATAEQAPDPACRVVLGSREDRFGMRLPHLVWRVGEWERRSIRRAQELLAAAWQAAGVGRLEGRLGEERPRRLFRGHWHHLGTTRMDPDPTRGVVDEHSRVHGVANLYVTGSSVFPTGGYANPTLTIVALALRLADELEATLGTGMGPLW